MLRIIPASRGSPVRSPREPGLGHDQGGREPAGDREEAAEDDACAQRLRADRDLEEEPDDGAGLAVPGAAQEDGADPVDADLVRDPRLLGAARERVGEAPDAPEGDHEPRRGDQADGDPGGAGSEVAEHERESAAVGVGDDAGRHLEEEDRRFHRSPHQHEL
jgi:hypothetical protein